LCCCGRSLLQHAGDSAKAGELDGKRITSANIIGRIKRSLVNLNIETLLLQKRNTSVPGLKHIERLVWYELPVWGGYACVTQLNHIASCGNVSYTVATCRFVNKPLNVVNNGISVASVIMTKMFVTLMSKICP
jgi:hypothetical protein